MRYVKPHYYDDFRCIADRCPDTCCAGWQIVIDDDTLDKYEAYAFRDSDKDFATRLRKSIDWEEGCFLQHGRRCSMLNDQNLCDMIHAKGEEWLCDTCNRYPRHVEEFEGLREYSLSLSCPVAADMMLKMTEQTRYIVEEDEEPDPLEEEFEDFDFMLFTQLEDAREVIFAILRNRQLSMTERMAILMDMARDMQDCLDEDRLFELQDVIEVYGKRLDKLSQAEPCQGERTRALRPMILEGEDRYWQLKKSFEIYTKLERLREEWTEVLEGTYEELYAGGYKEYEVIYKEFREAVTDKWQAQQDQQTWEVFLEQILTFFLYTYFCGAVYDDCIYSKVAMSVMSTCYIQEFIMYTWLTQGKKVSLEECIRVAYRYAREIEHSDLNLNDLEQWLMDRR